jgi:hypothetical protein
MVKGTTKVADAMGTKERLTRWKSIILCNHEKRAMMMKTQKIMNLGVYPRMRQRAEQRRA